MWALPLPGAPHSPFQPTFHGPHTVLCPLRSLWMMRKCKGWRPRFSMLCQERWRGVGMECLLLGFFRDKRIKGQALRNI